MWNEEWQFNNVMACIFFVAAKKDKTQRDIALDWSECNNSKKGKDAGRKENGLRRACAGRCREQDLLLNIVRASMLGIVCFIRSLKFDFGSVGKF